MVLECPHSPLLVATSVCMECFWGGGVPGERPRVQPVVTLLLCPMTLRLSPRGVLAELPA